MNIYEVIGTIVANHSVCEGMFAEIGEHSDKIIQNGLEDSELVKCELNMIKMKIGILQSYIEDYKEAVNNLLKTNSNKLVESLIEKGFVENSDGKFVYEITGSESGNKYILLFDPDEMSVLGEAYGNNNKEAFKSLAEFVERIKQMDSSDETLSTTKKIMDDITSVFEDFYKNQ